jgi:hypothetical protein
VASTIDLANCKGAFCPWPAPTDRANRSG